MSVTVIALVVRRSDGKVATLAPVSADDGKALVWDEATKSLTWAAGGGGGVSSVSGTAPIVSSGGATPAISLSNAGVTYAKIQNVSATDKLLGRSTAGAGVVEEIACTAAGRALIDDTDNTAQRATLGLGTAATTAATAYDAAGAALVNFAPSSAATVPAGMSRIVVDDYECVNGVDTEIVDGARMEIT